ncbi:hypothetical protein [Rhodobacter capsulatus]|uniref:hypothetical protein n=1 Tax=Rhodobacter capsulatus TaxID=1061 RepID=UPI0040281205
MRDETMKYALRRPLDWFSDIALSPQTSAWSIGSAFLTGALLEISTHPKPGLVTLARASGHEPADLHGLFGGDCALPLPMRGGRA